MDKKLIVQLIYYDNIPTISFFSDFVTVRLKVTVLGFISIDQVWSLLYSWT